MGNGRLPPPSGLGEHLGASGGMWEHLGASSILEHLRASGSAWEHLWQHLGAHCGDKFASCTLVRASKHVWQHLGASKSSREHLGASGNIWEHLRRSKNIWEHLGALGGPAMLSLGPAVVELRHAVGRNHMSEPNWSYPVTRVTQLDQFLAQTLTKEMNAKSNSHTRTTCEIKFTHRT